MDGLWLDLRHGLRLVLRRPVASMLAIVALALGIGLTTTMFSIVNGAVLRGLPFERADRILHLARLNPAEFGADDFDVSIHDYEDWKARQRSFEELATFRMITANVSGTGALPERYRAVMMSPNTFRVLRVRPVVGRDFTSADALPGAPRVAILGYRVWVDRFDARPDIVGQVMRVQGQPAEVVGVMPEGFGFPSSHELWLVDDRRPEAFPRNEGPHAEVIGRLRDGVSAEAAAAEMATIAHQLEQEHPVANKGITVEIKSYVREFLGDEIIGMLFTMLAAVFLVLLIACANVANIVLAQTAIRTRELALRAAVGATRGRMIRQVLVEVLALSAVGASLGLALAAAGVWLFNRAIVDTRPPFWIDIGIGVTEAAFVTALAIVAAVAAGLVPAVRGSRTDVGDVLKDEGRGSGARLGRLSRGLVVVEIALSFGLLVTSALMIQNVVRLRIMDVGYATDDVLIGRLALPAETYAGREEQRRFADRARSRLEGLAGVTAVALGTSLPGDDTDTTMAIEGREYARRSDYHRVVYRAVSPSYFDVFRLEIVRGRALAASDGATALPVAVVSEALARRHFPGQDPIGRRIRPDPDDPDSGWRQIVGVVRDVVILDPQAQGNEIMYEPLDQSPGRFLSVAAQVPGAPTAHAGAVREAIRDVDADLPISGLTSMKQHITDQGWGYRVFGTLFLSFGVAALFMASVGLYGVMAFLVSRRTQEIGIRLALGADGRRVLALVMRQGLVQVVVGLLLGLGLALWLSNAMRTLVLGVDPWDVRVFAGVATALGLTGLLATLVPALRASRVDPMTALRYQ
ncbi:MAG: ABC transporter permease [Vicinamibacteraceae bacterium]|nr:ABC transporter permease [Vicinamibacteraceae bacterium]